MKVGSGAKRKPALPRLRVLTTDWLLEVHWVRVRKRSSARLLRTLTFEWDSQIGMPLNSALRNASIAWSRQGLQAGKVNDRAFGGNVDQRSRLGLVPHANFHAEPAGLRCFREGSGACQACQRREPDPPGQPTSQGPVPIRRPCSKCVGI